MILLQKKTDRILIERQARSACVACLRSVVGSRIIFWKAIDDDGSEIALNDANRTAHASYFGSAALLSLEWATKWQLPSVSRTVADIMKYNGT
jgi:hypothetical protein